MEVSFVEKQDAGLSILRSQASLRSLDVIGSTATAELELRHEGLAQLLDQLIGAGVRLRKFNDKDPSLEDVFMSVTKGHVN